MSEYSISISNLSESATLAVSDKARQLKRAGVDVLDLGGGDPDFNTPEHIVETALQAMKTGKTHYVASRGIPELREAIAAKTLKDSGVTYDPATEIVVMTGGKMAIYAAFAALLNPGDEVLLPEPAWVSYRPLIQLTGGIPVGIALDPNDNFRITEDVLQRHVTPRSKAILVNSPNNPLGRVLSRDEWQAIVNVAVKHRLFVISDEVYEKLLFDGKQHISAASFPEIYDRTITVNSFSKTYAMTGWRLGWIAGNKTVVDLANKIEQQVSTCAPTFAQWAGVTALTGPQDCVEMMRKTYEMRRDRLVPELNKIPGVSCANPEGAFYVFVRFEGVKLPSDKLAEALLDKVHVAGVPGIAFGDTGEGHLRMTFAAATETLEQVPGRIAKFMEQI
jgi:aspartate aminotransferase